MNGTVREWPVFDATFDDLFQNQTDAHTLGEEHAVSQQDVQVALALAFVLGQQIRIPARFLVDHQPLIDTLRVQEWERLAFAGLIQPAAKETDWVKFLELCGGSETEPPLVMSSFGGAGNEEMLRLWDKGRGHIESRTRFPQQFPAAGYIVDRLIAWNVRAHPIIDPAIPYRQRLRDRLKAAGASPEVLTKAGDLKSRGIALRELAKLAQTKQENTAFFRAAVSAKHDELSDTLLSATVAKPAGGIRIQHKRDVRKPVTPTSFPGLGAVINGMTGVDELVALEKDVRFRQLRSEHTVARLSGDQPIFHESLNRLGEHVATVLSIRRAEATAFGVALGVGGGAFTAAMALPEHSQIIIAGGSGLLLLAAATTRAKRLRRRLYYDREIHAEIVNAGHGQF